MANTKSAIKRMHQNERRRVRNRALRSRLRTTVKTARAAGAEPGTDRTARAAGAEPDTDRTALVAEAIRTLDKAVTKGIIHRNTAARKKSALARSLAPAR